MAIQQTGMMGLAGVGQNQEDLVAQIRREQQARNQAMTQNLGKYAGLAQSGMETAQQFGGALGVQDPRLQRNSKVIEARDAVRAKGITDPEQQIAELVRELSARGLYEEADRAAQRLKEAQDAKRKADLEERKTAVQEGELSLRKEQEARAGRLTDAQIAEINSRIKQGKFDVRFEKNPITGAIIGIYKVNKNTGESEDITSQVIKAAPATPTATGEKKDRPPLSTFGGGGGAATPQQAARSDEPPKYLDMGNGNAQINPAWVRWQQERNNRISEQSVGGA